MLRCSDRRLRGYLMTILRKSHQLHGNLERFHLISAAAGSSCLLGSTQLVAVVSDKLGLLRLYLRKPGYTERCGVVRSFDATLASETYSSSCVAHTNGPSCCAVSTY